MQKPTRPASVTVSQLQAYARHFEFIAAEIQQTIESVGKDDKIQLPDVDSVGEAVEASDRFLKLLKRACETLDEPDSSTFQVRRKPRGTRRGRS